MATVQEWSVKTFGNEDQLPRVPLPALDDTCDRFIAWCAPLLTAGQLAETEKALRAFAAPDGPGGTLPAALPAAAVDYKLRLDAELVPPVLRRGQPLTMEQNKYLFSATRIPGLVQDT